MREKFSYFLAGTRSQPLEIHLKPRWYAGYERHVGPGRFIHYGLHFLFPVLYTIRFECRLAVGLQIKRYMVGYDTRQPSRLYAVFIVQNGTSLKEYHLTAYETNVARGEYIPQQHVPGSLYLAHKSFTGKRYVFGP